MLGRCDDFEFLARHLDGTIYRIPYCIVRPPQSFGKPHPMQYVEQTEKGIVKLFLGWEKDHPGWMVKSQFAAVIYNNGKDEKTVPAIHPRIIASLGWFQVAMMREHEQRVPEGKRIMELFIARLQEFMDEQERRFTQAIEFFV